MIAKASAEMVGLCFVREARTRRHPTYFPSLAPLRSARLN